MAATPQLRRHAFNPDEDIKLIELVEIVMVMGLKISDEVLQTLSPEAQRHFVELVVTLPRPPKPNVVVQRPKIITPNT